LLEAEAGLDGDGEQVEHVGQPAADVALAGLDPAVQAGVGPEDEQEQEEEADRQTGVAGEAGVVPDEERADHADRAGDEAAGAEPVDGADAALAGVDELLAELLAVADRGAAATGVGEALERRPPGPLAQRVVQPAVGDVLA